VLLHPGTEKLPALDIVFDEAAGKLLKEEDWWFESEEGSLLKWYVDSFFHQPRRRIPVNGCPSRVGFLAVWMWTVTLMRRPL